MRRESGAAVVLAMLIAALAAAVAATVFADQQRWSRNVLHRRDQVQAQAIAMAGVQWARQVLQDDARSSTLDHLGEPWAMRLPPIPLDDGEIRGSIVDAQAGLNVNALGSVGTQSVIERGRIERLIARRGGPAAALDAIADWIDVDTIARERGAEDAYYLAQRMPALAANADVMRIAELAQVRGVTPAALAAIAPFVTALPAGTPVNLNTAPPEVLAAIVDNLDGDTLAGLVVSRAGKPYSTIAEFRARLPDGAKLPGEEALAVRSDYFLVTIEARQGATLARARALVKRSGSTWPAIVWEVVE